MKRKYLLHLCICAASAMLAASQGAVQASADTEESGWFMRGNKRCYAYEDGTLAVGEVTIDNVPYLFAPNGAQQTGWQTVYGKRYFYDRDGQAQFGWITWRGETYYVSEEYGKTTKDTDPVQPFQFDPSGVLLKGWSRTADGIWHYPKATGETVIDGTAYLFDADSCLLTGWQTASDGVTRYYDSETREILSGWITENGIRSYADPKDGRLTGSQIIDGKQLFFDASGALVTGFYTDDAGVTRCYDAETGEMLRGFCAISGSTYYFADDGAMQTGFAQISGCTYYFNDNGIMQTGFYAPAGHKYYFDENGVMQTGFVTVSGKTYYLTENGITKTGIQKIGGADYYLANDCTVQTGWITSPSGTCYAEETGILVSGWKRIDNIIYYFYNNHYRAAGPVEIDGVTYLLSETGIPQVGWYTAKDGKKYYGAYNAAAVTGWQTINGDTCYFDAKGVFRSGMATIHGKLYLMDDQNTGSGGMICKNEDRYYVKPDGELVFGWIKDGTSLYYLQPDGKRTQVSMNGKSNMALAYYAIRKLGCCYWYGTYGSIATEALYRDRMALYPQYYQATDFLSQLGGQVFDCCGLVKGYLWSDTVDSLPERNPAQDVSSTNMYISATERGTIDTCPWKIGTLLFRSDSWSPRTYGIHHVGVYIGNGLIMEAKGHEWGVILSSDPSFWTHWAQCKWTTDNSIVSLPN